MDWASEEVFDGIGLERVDQIDPVKGVEMIEMDRVVLNVLDAGYQVSDQACVVRDLDL